MANLETTRGRQGPSHTIDIPRPATSGAFTLISANDFPECDPAVQRLILVTREVSSPTQRLPEREDPRAAYNALRELLQAEEKLSDEAKRAMNLAFKKSGDKKRKVSQRPVFIHFADVGYLTAQYLPSSETAGAVMHDLVEDGYVPLEQIEADFSPTAVEIVKNLTEKKPPQKVIMRELTPHERLSNWMGRKLQQASYISVWPPSSVIAKTADYASNIADMVDDFLNQGLRSFDPLTVGLEWQLWRYDIMLDAFEAHQKETNIINPLLPFLRQEGAALRLLATHANA